jgi:replicative DNA helicase
VTVNVERTILDALTHDDDYARRVLPHLKVDYFESEPEKHVFTAIEEHFQKYNSLPTKETLSLSLKAMDKLNESTYRSALAVVDGLARETRDLHWLLDVSEKFCKERALYNALIKASVIIEDRSGKSVPDSIPDMLSEALAVGFDTRVGHDYVEDYEKRYDFYHSKEERVRFDIEDLNTITKGGIPKKTLTVILAGTGVGKTLVMCHQAAANLMDGKNVLYVTMEMAEEKIAERIDANLLNVRLDDLITVSKEDYVKRVNRVKERTVGRLIIKEYPTASAHAGHFRALIKELRLKKKFVPDVIYVDYINICNSSRIKQGAGVNSYTFVKAIAEELRGLAVENNVPLITATQVTRSGMNSSDVEMTDTSESIGLPFTADLMYAIISTEELEKLNQLMFKQLKNRFDDPSRKRKFMVGVDRAKMRLYNLEASAQADLNPLEKPVDGPQKQPERSSLTEDIAAKFKRFR